MHSMKTPLYQTHQIREFERLAIERFGISGSILMQRAGKAASDFLQRRWPQAQKIVLFCGSGNNGGDGYTLALLLAERGLKPVIWHLGEPGADKEDAKLAFVACQKANIPIHPFDPLADLEHPDLIVDAICGIGVKNNLRENIVSAIEKMHRAHVPIFALDIPTGIDSDTGKILGAAVHATATMTFIGLKIGLLTGSGIAYTGELASSDLQLPTDLFTQIEPVAEKMHLSSFANYLKARTRDWHKGLSGHVLIVGGALGFSGAAQMAGLAALRVGAGLVSIATCKENAPLMNLTCPELMCHGISSQAELEPLMAKADVIILGPGLGMSAWAKDLWESVCASHHRLLVDADGLNLLAENSKFNDNWVLTPHPGEAARLLKLKNQAVQEDRLKAIRELQKTYGGVTVLKGAGTLVYSASALPALCDKGNPGMATAGMGDVLSGVIAGLMAQGIPNSEAAKLGVCIHALAGDSAAKDGERGMIATDLMPFLRRLVNTV